MTEQCKEIIRLDDLEIFICRKKTKYMRINISQNPPHQNPRNQSHQNPLPQNPPAQEQQKAYIKLTCPDAASERHVQEFLATHAQWIRDTYARLARKKLAQLEILDAHAGEILLFGEWVPAMGLSELRGILGSYLNKRAPVLAESMGLQFSALRVRLSRTRFGSCTLDRLSFSILLVFATKAEIDYVIIHELAHIVHKNHSPRFWALVEQHCPGCKCVRKGLRAKYPLMIALLERAQGM